MLSREDESDVEVRFCDQKNINEFGRLNNRITEVEEDLAVLKTDLEKLDDASTDLMMGDGDMMKMQVGDSFVDVDEDTANKMVEDQQERIQKEISALEETKDSILARQAELKKALYGRFGKSINLEA